MKSTNVIVRELIHLETEAVLASPLPLPIGKFGILSCLFKQTRDLLIIEAYMALILNHFLHFFIVYNHEDVLVARHRKLHSLFYQVVSPFAQHVPSANKRRNAFDILAYVVRTFLLDLVGKHLCEFFGILIKNLLIIHLSDKYNLSMMPPLENK